jgi:PAS domain S-box-containing protein
VLKALGYPIYVVDERGQFTYVNDAFVDLVGYDRGTLLETEPDLIKTEDSVERINDALRRIVSASGPDMERLEVEIKAKDGTLIPCKDHIAALPFDEEFQGCAGILRDISDDRRRERALQRKNDRLQELISVISHDLRTPLMTARSAAELARATGETEQFETLDQSHARMEQMLDELLTLAQEGERATALDATPIEAVARRAWDTVDPAAATLDVESDLIVEADPGRLQRLFENLFTNAVRHAGAEVVVTVGDLSGPGAGFYVADDGPGIDSEYSETVLEPGFTTATDGTGFGLSIVNRIADAHDWELAVAESATGGARFEFSDVTPVDPDHTTQPELLG